MKINENENERPVFDIKPTRYDKALEATAITLLLLLWAFSFYSYSHTPEIVPIHFRADGTPDGYGDSRTVFLMPVVAVFLFVLMSLATKHPENFNYTVTVTPQNAERQYTKMLRLLKWVKVSVIMIILLIEFFSFNVATGKSDRLPPWMLFAVFTMVLAPVLYYLARSGREDNG